MTEEVARMNHGSEPYGLETAAEFRYWHLHFVWTGVVVM